VDFDRLRSAYVDLLADSVEFYDEVAVKELGRSPRHVLLLHENDLAALYLGDLVKRLRKNGWKIISPELAFQDPIASVEPDTLLLGQGRVIALAAAKGYTGESRRWEDEAMLQQEFERRRVWK
jgi:peptidoglycan-N-acetylglucosamine deacetylase